MGNETVKTQVIQQTNKQPVFKTGALMIASNEIITRLKNFAIETNIEFDDYSLKCVDNAIKTINDLLIKSGETWNLINSSHKSVDNLFSVLRYVATMKLNTANNEVAIKFRYQGNEKMLEAQTQGAGFDKLAKNFGDNLEKVSSFIVSENDKFTPPYIDGFEYVLPKCEFSAKPGKPLMAVYGFKKKDGSWDVTMSTRDDVKVSLISHINETHRSNNAYTPELKAELDKLTLDEIIYNPKYTSMMIGGKRLIGPAYSEGSKESMVVRKLRNWALKKWSHNLNFDKQEVADIYKEFWDEEDRPTEIKPSEFIENNQQEFEKENSSVKVEETVKGVGEKVVPVEETVKEPIPVVVETKKEETKQDDDIPEYLRL